MKLRSSRPATRRTPGQCRHPSLVTCSCSRQGHDQQLRSATSNFRSACGTVITSPLSGRCPFENNAVHTSVTNSWTIVERPLLQQPLPPKYRELNTNTTITYTLRPSSTMSGQMFEPIYSPRPNNHLLSTSAADPMPCLVHLQPHPANNKSSPTCPLMVSTKTDPACTRVDAILNARTHSHNLAA